MKIAIAYPPLAGKGSPMLTQNRQFQWYHAESFIYPVVAASAATLLRQQGFAVVWADHITEKKTADEFCALMDHEQPDIIAMETKTPVVKLHWQIADNLKQRFPAAKIVLMGDHVTALPEETLRRSRVDYVLTGGDYDFMLLNLARHLDTGAALEPGWYFRDGAEIKSTGRFELNHDLNTLPFIDRQLTKAHLYGEKWKKRQPFFYMMEGRDCPWGRCTFCAWQVIFPKFRTMTVERTLDEIGHLIEHDGAREIFDDSGTIPGGAWLREFCAGMMARGYHKEILFSCNMRFDYLTDPELPRLMKRAGFRKIKSGLESANQATLDKINKGTTVDHIVTGCRNAARAGIDVHLTVMVGYPWETRADAQRTLDLARRLMAEGSAEMLQATIVVPYPGTPMNDYVIQHGLLRFAPDEYEKYDMRGTVIQLPDMSNEEVIEMCNGVYRSFLTPQYMLRQALKNLHDPSYLWRGAKAVLGHLKDFSR